MIIYLFFLISACATPCESGFCNGTICCDINCIGGCTGPSASDCVACKDVMYYGDGIQKPVCVKKCPQGTIKVCITNNLKVGSFGN